MRRILLALALLLPLAAMASDNDTDKVNGDVHVTAGQHVGKASSVNGDVDVADHAVVEKASTVNGEVKLGQQAQAGEVDTVNGDIEMAAGARVQGKVEAVNGAIHLARGAEVDGHLSNVNGTITLEDAHAAAGIETVAGDITIGANSRVEGGILVDKPNNGWFHSGSTRKPVIVIGPHAVVQGTLEFRREVVLKVSDSAQIGPVKGATVEKFSGATP
ncbi:polymer-forming cytoskeletal protein [Rhodanobacter glycinis]|uniref:Polymer-forming cytoskeletal protein n=1 Tax=Rhodanobacter glycinis TaxID=582702 RepID=A0A1I4B220_9GAMM|nr:polymer-forming cytoskeletal protein [Rhodanobacter glycinis]SFK62420.1 hypothetical protein SAMN05192579_104228 [Rhodanobacter glycinis]